MGTLGKIGGIGAILGGAALGTVGANPMAGAALAGAGVGMTKREFSDIPKEMAQRKLAAETERLAPWTNLHGQLGPEGSSFDEALKGGATGAAIGQQLGASGAATPEVVGTSAGGGAPSLGVDTQLNANYVPENIDTSPMMAQSGSVPTLQGAKPVGNTWSVLDKKGEEDDGVYSQMFAQGSPYKPR